MSFLAPIEAVPCELMIMIMEYAPGTVSNLKLVSLHYFAVCSYIIWSKKIPGVSKAEISSWRMCVLSSKLPIREKAHDSGGSC